MKNLNETEKLLQKALVENDDTSKLSSIVDDESDLIRSMLVRHNEVILEEDAILSIKGEQNYNVVSASCGICTIMGKPKSRKTMLATLIIGNFLNTVNSNGIFDAKVPNKKKLILFFDTEQSRNHIIKIYSRVKSIAQTNDIDNLLIFSLREFDPLERVKRIEMVIKKYSDTFLVVIDGIRDLVFDINSMTESTLVTTKLLQWAEEHKLHIINVIHQNKSDNNARGSLGTELMNKSDSIISVTLIDSKSSLVKAVKTRDKEFSPFGFEVNEFGVPYLVENVTRSVTKRARKIFIMENISLDEHRNFLNKLFPNGLVVGYSNLKNQLKAEWITKGYELGDAVIVKLIKFYADNGLIFKDGSTRPSKYLVVL